MEKNTRLVYIDEDNIEIYNSLPPKEFKEFFMTFLKYKVGDEVDVSDFSTPLLYALFKTYQAKIDYNEVQFNKKKKDKDKTYKELLKDDRWKEKRLEIIERDNYQCQCCHKTFKAEQLNVHHKEYHRKNGELVDPWDYDDEFLVTLCSSCHKKMHNKSEGNWVGVIGPDRLS